ncbi:MAG TPA: phytanoyl-CoA dioxygenase family protein [Chthoniobacterales bacterium]|jgi:ectoine hydroxylase-related dioxygenase (phytanoyl-CoA dioxygenase family)
MNTAVAPFISKEQEEQFREDGYCVVDGLFDPDELREIEAFFEEYKNVGGKVYDGGRGYDEIDPAKTQLRAMHPHRYSKKAETWLLNQNVASVLEVLLGKPPLAAQSMYYFKPPGARGQGMHQDNFYLLAAPATCIAAWTAIDAAEVENGCLYVVPGSNKKGIFCPETAKEETWFEYGDTHIKPFPREMKPIPVEVPKGSTMFFGGHLIHGSGPNRSKHTSRRTFIGHYIDEASEQVAGFYHPVLAMDGSVVSNVEAPTGGGPCGDGWLGAVH